MAPELTPLPLPAELENPFCPVTLADVAFAEHCQVIDVDPPERTRLGLTVKLSTVGKGFVHTPLLQISPEMQSEFALQVPPEGTAQVPLLQISPEAQFEDTVHEPPGGTAQVPLLQ